MAYVNISYSEYVLQRGPCRQCINSVSDTLVRLIHPLPRIQSDTRTSERINLPCISLLNCHSVTKLVLTKLMSKYNYQLVSSHGNIRAATYGHIQRYLRTPLPLLTDIHQPLLTDISTAT